MIKKQFFIILCCCNCFTPLLYGQESSLDKKYERALNYFYTEYPTDQSDSTAIQLLEEIKSQFPTNALTPSQSADVYEKLGTLYLIQNQPQKSIEILRRGLKFIEQNKANDSLLFNPYLYMGESFFLLNQADSSIHYLNQAEKKLDAKKDKQETGRLYNSLGVIYYESGNYAQATNYFSKARSIVTEKSNPEPSAATEYAIFSFLTNEAAAWANLKVFDKAVTLYQEALNLGIDRDEVLSKLASLYIKNQNPDSARYYLDSIAEQASRNSLPNQNIKAEIHLLKGQADKALELLIPGLDEEKTKNAQPSQVALDYHKGKTYQIIGRSWMEKKEYQMAAEAFHKAILQFDGVFSQEDIWKNPSPGNINWGMTDIFESLVLKAKSTMALAKVNNDMPTYQLSFDTYQVAFDLVFYLNNLYDNQDARIFLGESIRKAYEEAVSASMALYQLTKDQKHLVRGFIWAEESKATALELARNEGKIKANSGIPLALLQEEKILKFQLTRANQKIREVQDPNKLEDLEAQVRDSKLALSRLYASYNDFSSFFDQKLNTERIRIQKLQNFLQSGHQVLLSYFVANDVIFCFMLSEDDLYLSAIIEKGPLTETIKTMNQELISSRGNNRQELEQVTIQAFDQMLGEAYPDLKKHPNWIIIPDQILVHVPFEMLSDPEGNYLVENHAITYQYSGKLLQMDASRINSDKEKAIGFAPFTATTEMPETNDFAPLPAAASEMELLKGRIFLGTAATKQEFLAHSENASIIHLATHALSTPESPEEGFIVFSPSQENHLLYAEELYQLDLRQASLVFLSACDTHRGQVMNGEGLISLSRGFSYAGCDNIISSIWKANDKVTAYLSEVFYDKVNQGNTYPEALQLAKKTLLKDTKMAQYHHPYFWANMVFIGNTFEATSRQAAGITLSFLLLILVAAGFIWFWKKKRGL